MTSFTRRTTPGSTAEIVTDANGQLHFKRGVYKPIGAEDRPIPVRTVFYCVETASGDIESGKFTSGPEMSFNEFLLETYGINMLSDNLEYEVLS